MSEPPEPGRGAGPLVRVGTVLRLQDQDYLYGVGELVLRVALVDPDLGRYPGLEWVRMRGVQIRWDGSDGEVRDVLVRVAALKQSRRDQ